MALSTAAKAGLGGSLGTVAVGGPAATYYAWDYITLYEVEREVLEKDLKFTAANTASSNKVTIKVPESTESVAPRLESEHKWTCEITVTTSVTGGDANNEAVAIKKELDGRFLNLNKDQKIGIVKACSKNRDQTDLSSTKVKGRLDVDVIGDTQSKSYKFKNHKELDYLLDFFMKEVEWEVVSRNAELELGNDEPTNGKVEIKAKVSTSDTSEDNKLAKDHSWSCEITVTPASGGNNANSEAISLKSSLGSKISSLKAEDKLKLVKACAKDRDTTDSSSEHKVKGKLVVTVDGNTGNYKFSFEKNPELNSLLKT